MKEEKLMPDFLITKEGLLSALAIQNNIKYFSELIEYIRNLPYGRISQPADLAFVFHERKGTCSSKHALLKSIADEQGQSDVKLMIGIYKMNAVNTPGIGSELAMSGLDYLPEAHCYLMYKGLRLDFTSAVSHISKIKKDILKEYQISPDQIGTYKIELHKNYIQEWKDREVIPLSLDQLWSLRERCITNLSMLPRV